MRSYFPWTDDDVTRLRALVAAGQSSSQIARAMGRSLASVENKRRELLVPFPRPEGAPPGPNPLPPKAPRDPVADAQAARERQRALADERRELEALAGERAIRSTLERLVSQTVPAWPTIPHKPLPAATGDTIEETLILHLSDWHAYQRVSEAGTRGFNQYDATTFARRVQHVVTTARQIATRLQKGGYRFPRLVIALNGDLVSGTIHEVERHTDAPSIVHAVYGTGMVLAQAIRDLATTFPAIDVFCTSGNHGRLPDARRIQQDDPWRSWDTLIALFAREALRATPRVTWHLPQAWSCAYEVEGWRVMQTHGHDVKSWNAIPWYGLNRLVTSINALEAGRGTPLNLWLFGHFHNASSLSQVQGEAFINGSLIGGTTFSINALGRSDRPSQWLLGVHRDHGVTHRWPLYADHLPDDVAGYDVQPWEGAA